MSSTYKPTDADLRFWAECAISEMVNSDPTEPETETLVALETKEYDWLLEQWGNAAGQVRQDHGALEVPNINPTRSSSTATDNNEEAA